MIPGHGATTNHRYLIQGVLVPPRVAWFLDRYLGAVRKELGGRDEQLDAVLLDITYAATDYHRRYAIGTTTAQHSEPVSHLEEWLTTSMAARRLNMTSRAIVKAINENRLMAEKHDGRWRIQRAALDHYQALRAT